MKRHWARFVGGMLAALTALLAFPLAAGASSNSQRCDIRDFGAVSRDESADTDAIQQAVDQCSGTGGTVLVPAGDWSTGTVRLGSNMTFLIDDGAVLSLHPDIALFPETIIRQDEGTASVRAALLADGVTGLRIDGAGRIEGNGEAFWDEDFYDSGLRRPTLPRPGPVIELANCRDTHLSGITMTNMPAYAVRFHACSDVSATGITIRNDPRSPNTDGIQIRDTSNMRISDVDIRTGDDAIVLKSGQRPVDNILVEDSYLESDDAALKFGTSSHVGVTNSVFRNLQIRNSRYGIAIFMIDGGMHQNNVFENIDIETGGRHLRQFPIFIDIDRRDADRSLGRVVDTVFRDMTIMTGGASLIAGNPEAPIEGLSLQNITISVSGPIDLATASSKPRGNIEIEGQRGSVDYSSANAHFALGHIRGLSLNDIAIVEQHGASTRADMFMQDVLYDLPLDSDGVSR
ncbi:glycoside hydrolase family 28 protein [Aurantiacibacter gangjinensis]|uniref:Uncharacterized protein n=1 Tax=Aurantiacibacter gangjinensis TaxID=502682 RepID=A0A0G9MRJ6_9SPHN|nr:glycosyl hydrolase family 28 protein [Aurantiacibacter gangjinensis]APE26888.1 Polygalacturonase [Aurantiacibacter gangjinensis]KLE33352.1 hypothetical protein AAW01_05290 [Aurantiacibacter gangjinensis]